MAHQEACQLYIEQEIKDRLALGESPYSIGKDLSSWVEKLFEASIPARTIEQKARRLNNATFVAPPITHENHSETKNNQVEHGGYREGSGRPLKYEPAPLPPPLCSLHTGDQESYTPAKYIESARLVMGSIDLDPASNETAQKTVKATTYFAKEDNGLDYPWDGPNIFLNPPYSHPDIKYFVDKLLAELKPGQQAILLTNNNTDTNFFHDAARKAAAICFTKGRINFMKPDGSTSSPTNGQTFFYFGNNKESFINEFSQYGLIMELSKNGFSRNN